VLVADDDRAVRALVRVTLMAQGWRVLEATTPDETLTVAGREQPQIVTARSKPLGDLERRRGSGDIQQLEPGVEHDGNDTLHGRFCRICVISDSIEPS